MTVEIPSFNFDLGETADMFRNMVKDFAAVPAAVGLSYGFMIVTAWHWH